MAGLNLNKETFIRVISYLPTLDACCELFMKTAAQIEDWCKENFDGHTFGEIKGAVYGEKKLVLAEAQYKTATVDKNPIMQIWLGKNMLGQVDKVENKLAVEPITFINDIKDE